MTDLNEACEPWKMCSGDPPDWDSPLMNVWQAAICWTLSIVGKQLGATDWEGGDGTETLDGDVAQEVMNIMRAAGLVNKDGDPIRREDLAAQDFGAKCNCEQEHYLPAWHCPVHGEVIVPMD